MILRLLLLLTFVLNVCVATAQNSFLKLCDSMFSNLKTTAHVYKSCLWNYGFTDSSIFKFRGQYNDELTDYSNWSDAYQYWENSVMDPQFKPMPYSEVLKRLNTGFNNGIIDVPTILAIGDRISKTALESKRIEFDTASGQLILNDVHDLFQTESIFITTPFVQRVFSRFISLNFHDSLFYTNSDLTVKEVQIRLNNELFHSINYSELINLELQPGNNTLVVKHFLSDGKVYISNTTLVFDEYESTYGNSKILGFGIGDPQGNIYAEPYRTTEYELPLGANIQVIPGIENGVEHQCIKKPIIFVEGIDFGYKDHETGCYGGKCGAMGLRDLLRGKIFHPYERKDKNAYEEWEPIKLAPKLIDELKSAGYDLIYLDFHNGAEYMENNAMLLIDLIKRVNYMKCSKEELVVIGASMGGQITRFALSYMEKANMPHCVRTFLAYDSPNQGAVIPLGLQHFLKYYSGKLPTVKEQFRRKLDRAASRQLLMNHCLSMDGAGENSDRVSFRFALDALGNYPKACRNIALLNGSIDKTDFGHTAGDVLLKMNPFLGTINFDIAEINCTIWSTYYDVDFKHIVMEGKFPGKGKYLVEVPIETPQYDFVPGSKRYDLKSYRSILGVFNIINAMEFTCFIPSKSALDLSSDDPYFDINGRLNKDIPNPLYTPFEAFYGVRGEGQEHMMITDDNIDWILNQIELNRNEMPDVLSSTYNMGRVTNNRLNTILVKAGILKINGKGRNGFGNGKFDQVNKPGSLYTAITDNCRSVVTIDDKGVLELGTDAANDGNKAVLIVRKGSVLELNGGSILLINNHSKLVVEEGAQLIYNKDATIVLDGNDAQIQIDGELHIGNSAVFTVQQGASKVPGYLKFRNVGGGYGACKITYDVNAEFKLTGNSKSTDLLMQVEGELNFIGNTRLKMFKLENGKVAYGNYSSVNFFGDVNIKNSSFEVLSWAMKNTSKAIVLKGFKKANITQSDFQNFNFGVETKPSVGAELIIENTILKSCVNALVLSHPRTELNNVVLRSNTEHGLFCYDQFEQLKMGNVQLLFNSKGIYISSNLSLPPKCFIDNCSFSSNDIGIQSVNAQITLLCSRFISNTIGIDSRDGALNLSPNFVMFGNAYSLSGGNNTFSQQNGIGIKCDHTILYLEDGKNNFMYTGNNNNGKLISGVVTYLPATHQTQSPYYLKANNNYWSPISNIFLNQLGVPYYDLKSDLPGQPNSTNKLSGNMMKIINTVCYNAGGCLTCPITQFEEDSVGYGPLDITVYPQPANDVIKIRFNHLVDSITIQLNQMDGKLKYENKFLKTDEVELSVKDWTSGFYVLKVQIGEKEFRKRIIIE